MPTNATPIPTYAIAKQRADTADLSLIEDWLDEWIDSGQSKNGQQYARYLTKLSAVLVSQGKTLPEATTADLRAFIRDATDGLSPSTKSFVIRAIKRVYGWLSVELEIPDPAAKLKAPQVPWGDARTISVDEHDKLVASITSRSMGRIPPVVATPRSGGG